MRASAGAQEQVPDVLATAARAIEVIIGNAIARHLALDGNFAVIGILTAGLAVAVSNTSSTVAVPTGLRVDEPEKITSDISSPRNTRAEPSPITQRTASMMLDLPQPLGPTMPVRLVGAWKVVGSTKDLKPASFIAVSRMN